MADVHGRFDDRFAGVRDALAATLDSGADVGASVAVVLNGETVVDIWGGHADEARTTPWLENTITNVWSTTKTMTFLCTLILADRGELDLYGKVASYWPEFAANGKGDIEVRHLLSHTSGLSGWQEPMTMDDLCDWDKCTTLLAAQAPWWEPGTASGYHAFTQGYLIGEVVRRVTGQSIGTFFAKEIAGPLGADFHIGLDPSQFQRVANVIPPVGAAGGELDPTSVAFRTFSNPPPAAEASWTSAWRQAEIPAAGGHGNARSVATIQAIVANGGEMGGQRFLSEKGCAVIFDEQAAGVDLVLGIPMHIGMGYGLNSADTPLSPNARTCFWGGWGGSLAIIDTEAHLAIAYMMNRMGEGTVGDERGASFIGATYAALAAG